MNRVSFLAILFVTITLPLVSSADTDGDGYDDDVDVFPNDDQQWNDSDEDGFGDNPVQPNGDGCPLEASAGNQGCPITNTKTSDKIQGQFGTNGFNFAILISGIIGCVMGVLYSRKSLQNSAKSDQDVPLAFFLILIFVCSVVYTNPPLLSDTHEKEYSNHDTAHVFVTGHESNAGIEELDEDQDGITDGISVDYDVDYGGQDTIPVEIQTNLTITHEDGVSMHLSQRRNITGQAVEVDTFFNVKPWSLGNYTAEIAVKVFGQDNEQHEDSTNFQQDEVEVLEILDQPLINFSSQSQISEDEACWVNLTAEDPLYHFWSEGNQLQDTTLTLVTPESLEFSTNDWEEVNISCDDLSQGEHTFVVEIENTFQQQSVSQFILNITVSNESVTNETNEANETNESDSTNTEIIEELVYSIEIETEDFCRLRFISELQTSAVVISTEDKEINITQLGNNPTISCDDWGPRVYHLNTSLSDGNGSEGWKHLTLVIPDPVILAYGTGSIIDEVQSEDAKLVFTYLAALSIFVTFSMAMIMAFFHSRMFGKESIKGDYISDLATFRMNSKRRE